MTFEADYFLSVVGRLFGWLIGGLVGRGWEWRGGGRGREFFGWLVGWLPDVIATRNIYLRDGSAQNIETDVADSTCYLIQSHYTDTGPASPSTDPTGQAPERGGTTGEMCTLLVLCMTVCLWSCV